METVSDPGWQMCLPLIFGAIVTVLLGMFSAPLVEFFRAVAGGII